MLATSALLIGGTGPTGPAIAAGLEARGYDLTILHSGRHEVPEVARFRHIHGDVFSEEGVLSALGDRAFDSVSLTDPAEPGFVPRALRLPVWHTRLMPDLAGGPPLVSDLARNIVTDFSVAQVWTGTGALEFYESEFEELSRLRPTAIVVRSGARWRSRSWVPRCGTPRTRPTTAAGTAAR